MAVHGKRGRSRRSDRGALRSGQPRKGKKARATGGTAKSKRFVGRPGDCRVVCIAGNVYQSLARAASEMQTYRMALEIVAWQIHPQHMEDQMCNQLAPYVIQALTGLMPGAYERVKAQWDLIGEQFKNMKVWPPEVKRDENEDCPF